MKKFASDVGTVFNRAVQFTEEKLGTTEKTELDAHFENLLQRADKTKVWTEKVMRSTECLLQPNPNVRMEDMFYEKLDKKKRDRENLHESLGNVMVDAGNEYGPGTSYGNSLVKCGQTQIKIGNAEREFTQTTCNVLLQPLKSFLDGDMKTIQKEKKILEVKRLDLDASKNRLRKAKSAAGQTQQSNAAIELAMMEAEADLRVAQAEFDRQAEITKLLLEGVSSAHAHHLRCMNDFIEGQMTHYAQCQQYMQDLQRQLGSPMNGEVQEITQSFNAVFDNYNTGTVQGQGHSSQSLGERIPSSLSVETATPSAPPMIQVIAATPNIEKKQARVLYDYDAADSSELSLLADELITVFKVNGMDPDWLMAERGSQRGKVPTTYLDVLQ